jgi:signal transduction histidine kinase
VSAACALEALDDLVVMTDEEGSIAWANPAFVRLVGVDADWIVGSRFEEFVAEEDLVSLVGFASVLGVHGGSHNLLLDGKDGPTQALVSTAMFVDEGAPRVVLVGRRMVDLQAEAAEQSRQAADEREKVDALEAAHRELGAMHRELMQTQATLMRASRMAGMAEVATNVLHEVGNSLNSVGVGVEMLGRHLDAAVIAKLRKTTALLGQEIGDSGSPRLAKALQLLELLISSADTQLHTAAEESHRIRANVEHVKNIVAAQQQHAKGTDLTELVPLAELVNEVLMQLEPGMRDDRIEIVTEVDDTMCELYRHKFAQVLGNLLTNASEAARRVERRVVAIRGRTEGARVVVTVEDSGPGVPYEMREQIFQHGFTTRPEKQGFGLHASANAAQQLGGALTVSDSEGLGGAMFTLEFPRDRRHGPFRGHAIPSLPTLGVDGTRAGEHRS